KASRPGEGHDKAQFALLLRRNHDATHDAERPSSAAKASWRGFCECKRHDSLTLSVCSALLGGIWARLVIVAGRTGDYSDQDRERGTPEYPKESLLEPPRDCLGLSPH